MNVRLAIILAFLFFNIGVHAQLVESLFSKVGLSGTITGRISSVATGPQGYTYILFNHGPIELNGDTVPTGGSIAKLNALNEVIWHQDFFSAALGFTSQMAVDHDGNIYFSGHFPNDIQFGTDTLIVTGPYNSGFLTKLDHTGSFQWAKTYANAQCTDLCLRPDGGVVLMGEFDNDLIIENDTHSTAWGTTSQSVFIASYTEDGIKDWSIPLHCISDIRANHLNIDEAGNLYFGGRVHNNYYISDSLFASAGSCEGYWVILSETGSVKQVNYITGPGCEYIADVVPDNLGNVFITGAFALSADFGGTTLTDATGGDIYLAKYDTTGSLEWVSQVEGNGIQWGEQLILDEFGNAFVSGTSEDTIDFAGYTLASAGSKDVIVLKFDSTGTHQWGIIGGGISTEAVNDLALAENGDVLFSCVLGYSATFGPHTPYGPSGVVGFLARIKDGANQILGEVFNDLNGNGTRDAGDELMEGIMVRIMPDNHFYRSNDIAGYRINTQLGSKTIDIPNPPLYYSVSPTSHSANFIAEGELDSLNHFALTPIPGIKDVSINLLPVTASRPGFQNTYLLSYANIGTDTALGMIQLVLDSVVGFVSASVVPDSILGDTLIWEYAGLLPGEDRNLEVITVLDPTFPIDSLLSPSAVITPVLGDSMPSNNFSEVEIIVTGAFDPNDKRVFPDSSIDLSDIISGLPLKYIIRFQNTGTDTAFTVIVRDTLDDWLDLGTFEMLGASHDFELLVENGKELTWRFHNILLPDSNVNEVESHGAISYSIAPQPTVAVGDTIFNSASIYFDYNAPIITNSTQTVFQLLVSNELLPEEKSHPLLIFPNPANTFTNIEWTSIQAEEKGEISLFDTKGTLLIRYQIPIKRGKNRITIPLSKIPEGVSFIKVQTAEFIQERRLLKIRE